MKIQKSAKLCSQAVQILEKILYMVVFLELVTNKSNKNEDDNKMIFAESNVKKRKNLKTI